MQGYFGTQNAYRKRRDCALLARAFFPRQTFSHESRHDANTESLRNPSALGGWFISVAHGIVEEEKMDIKVEDLTRIMARMKEYADKGELWITDLNEATRYLRERQNTTVSVSGEGDQYTVSLRMKDFTEDGLPLPTAIFDYPLTVRLTLPSHTMGISYSVNGETNTASAFDKGDARYAYAELPPNTNARIKTNY